MDIKLNNLKEIINIFDTDSNLKVEFVEIDKGIYIYIKIYDEYFKEHVVVKKFFYRYEDRKLVY